MIETVHKTGAVSESMVRAYLHAQGFEVFSPDQGTGRADLIYIDKERAVRVQVKSAVWVTNPKHRHEQCHLVTGPSKMKYSSSEIDELWVVGTHLWCLPIELVAGRTTLNLHTSNPTPRKTRRDHNPNEFIKVFGRFDRPFKDRLSYNEPEPDVMIHNDTYSPLSERAMFFRNRKTGA